MGEGGAILVLTLITPIAVEEGKEVNKEGEEMGGGRQGRGGAGRREGKD